MFTFDDTGRDSDAMFSLYKQDEMYRKYLLLDTEASTRTEIASLTAGGDGRELNRLWLPVLSIFTYVVSKSILIENALAFGRCKIKVL